ncbi:MAG: PQQ-like beta-propeller repeat protein [Verrucomicrobia bacterium]|nr:PQQ-like beta-propeller repeat protein [Verrucomicrobiota bacterium]
MDRREHLYRLAQQAPIAVGLLGLAFLLTWLLWRPVPPLAMRVPGRDRPVGEQAAATTVNPAAQGRVVRGPGEPADLPGFWPCFRGPKRDGVYRPETELARAWPEGGPKVLWSIDVGEGYAGAVVAQGRVYVMDYDQKARADALRCLSLADGAEIWRFTYPIVIKRNHGMSRTVPAVAQGKVVAMGPKCHVICVDALTGELKWALDLARDYGTTVPPWYAGQCPLIEDGKLILAPAGPEVLLMAVDLETGKPLWKTPNPFGWKMTHSSITPVIFEGSRQYVYCASGGEAGVDAKDGRLLWSTDQWKINIATVPSPVDLGEGRIFLTGGYNAGSMLLRLVRNGDAIEPKIVYRLKPRVFGAVQHTPVFIDGMIYGIRADGRLVCLSPEGKPVWESERGVNFGLGPFLVAGDLIYAMNDRGLLVLFERKPDGRRELARAQVLHGHESWAPICPAAGRLIVRDLTKMACLDARAQ